MVEIAFEGIDGSGKSTQVKLLHKTLENLGRDVFTIIQPKMTKTGETLRHYLKEGASPELLALLFAANRVEIAEEIKTINYIYNEPYILQDRSLYSNLVYSNLDEDWFWEIEKYSPEPDYVVFLDINPAVAFERCKGDEAYENLEKLQDACLIYGEIAVDNNWISIPILDFETPQQIHESIVRQLIERGIF